MYRLNRGFFCRISCPHAPHARSHCPTWPWLSLTNLFALLPFSRTSSKVELPKAVKPAVLAAVTNALLVAPSFAGEPGKIFDFNLTLPIIATEFLLLMVILDKTIFGPVGKALDDRDALIRDQLAAVGDNSTAVADLIVSTSYISLESRERLAQQRVEARVGRAYRPSRRAIAQIARHLAILTLDCGLKRTYYHRFSSVTQWLHAPCTPKQLTHTDLFPHPPPTVREGGSYLLRARRGCQGGCRHEGQDGRGHHGSVSQGQG